MGVISVKRSCAALVEESCAVKQKTKAHFIESLVLRDVRIIEGS